ncbi:MAG: trypsin-like peptidase domain-containing protein [Candidatus Nealsonbacteria bacterium]|nr:trypsin-like peptidase domain-containing protein [Candidatus Nealsonbacteria bacterium]
MTKNILKILAIFIIGTIGGIFADQILWPYFVERPLFLKYKLEQTPVYVTERKEVTNYIQENVALKEAAGKAAKTIVGVKTETNEGNILRGSGLVVSNDGFFVTLADLVPQGSDFAFYVGDKWPEYQILKRDLKSNLALVKVDGAGLATAGFADLEKIKIGERVFLSGFDFSSTTPQMAVNEGIIKIFDKNLIQTNIFDAVSLNGSPLFDIEGNVIGLSIVGSSGQVSAIPAAKIRQFIGF